MNGPSQVKVCVEWADVTRTKPGLSTDVEDAILRPDALARCLKPLALDLRWAWSNTAQGLWERIDADLWHCTYSPWIVLQSAGKKRLEELGEDEDFLRRLDLVKDEQKRVLPWFSRHAEAKSLQLIAYFSMEFGLNEALPIYSGGLGVLAGDHLKSASDLAVPVVGVGLLYGDGYFRQILDCEGGQYELYPRNDSEQLPIEPLRDADGNRIRLPLHFPGRMVYLQGWEAKVGRTRLLLLDSNHPANHPADRAITNRLYGGGSEERLQQEIILGIGGRRLLKALNLEPDVCHLNEGHAAFAVLEHAGYLMLTYRCSFAVALRAARAGTVFTTHTAVEAAFDRFEPRLIARYLSSYADQLGLGLEGLLRLGRLCEDEHEPFTMAYLAMRGATRVNAVSRLHGEVSQELFQPLFARFPNADVPVDYVTNGVHTPTWAGPEAEAIVAKGSASDDELWEMRNAGRARLVNAARERLVRRLRSLEASSERVAQAQKVLDPHVMTIGFARRFATYKRPTLLLSQPERLAKLLLNAEFPVQLVVAGKAHPRDMQGKALIREWVTFAERHDVRHRVMFIDDYDLYVAEELVQGSDLWLNNPRRPWEASGTSGMKVLVNGGLNLSELDGWWAEAYEPGLGWALGDGRMHENDPEWDALEADTLYSLLENEIIPRFYRRDAQGVPREWISTMRRSMSRLTEQFSTDRMVREYTERIYLPAAAAQRERLAEGAKKALELETQIAHVREHWNEIRFGELREEMRDGKRCIDIAVELGAISSRDVRVELYAESGPAGRSVISLERQDEFYSGVIEDDRPLSDYTTRIWPAVEGMISPLEAPFVAWHDRITSMV